ncbi:hypothetical protein E3P91_00642 [Wallemia ichthyophaga]|nr:hypothetical protein E3P91_00642 [Wallemia ichthyophaga]
MDEITIAHALSNRISIDVERSLMHQEMITPPHSTTSTNFSINSRTSEILRRVLPPQKPIPTCPVPPIPSHPYANSTTSNSFTGSSPASSPRPDHHSHALGAPSVSSAQSIFYMPNFDEWSMKSHQLSNMSNMSGNLSSNESTHEVRESRQSFSRFSKRKSKVFSTRIRNFFKE